MVKSKAAAYSKLLPRSRLLISRAFVLTFHSSSELQLNWISWQRLKDDGSSDKCEHPCNIKLSIVVNDDNESNSNGHGDAPL
jgi:hypothetical protein